VLNRGVHKSAGKAHLAFLFALNATKEEKTGGSSLVSFTCRK
jgi:hypothetical protein